MIEAKKISDLGERRLIQRIARTIRTDPSVIRGIGDDCAVLAGPPGKSLLFTCDMLVEGIHFVKRAPARHIGWKAMAVNVSDIAAMGGIPRYAVISLGLPRSTSVRWVDGLYQGLRQCAHRFGVNIVGGDTNRSERIIIDVAILGEGQRDRVVYRSGARVGDFLLVTGSLGGAVRSGRHLTFTPRLREARALVRRAKPHAMIDLSDGLYPDLIRLCEASGVGAVLEADRIPRHPHCSAASALTEGEDFELLLAVSYGQAEKLLRWAKKNLLCGLTRIGRVVPYQAGPLVKVLDSRGRSMRVSLSGFEQFPVPPGVRPFDF